MSKEYHVSIKTGNNLNCGSAEKPFKTISKAAETAVAGDKIIVHSGTYREWVKPQNGGTSDSSRIIYEAADGENVIIKGSEAVTGWERLTGSVYRADVPNEIFGGYNPYSVRIDGDWFVRPLDYPLHTGQVYFEGNAYLEAHSRKHLADTPHTWLGEVGEDSTSILVNFGSDNPNDGVVEINVRRSCFYPDKTGVNFITLRGFEIVHGATPWAPPTADQPGIIGANWSKGWIIENNTIHDVRCSAVSIGKESSTGDNLYTKYHRKPGYQYQFESVMNGLRCGWSREQIGSHIIRNNTIYNCGQNAIVGHMGCAFSKIYGNHIYNICHLEEFFGHEIAGIKLHAAIDTEVYENRIHNCRLAMWFDWQAQGIRISRNICHDNGRDLWVEVSHGPYIVDNNIFASDNALANASQGGAYIHNLFMGGIYRYNVLDRSTPYHLPHSTEVAGTALIYGYDDRLYQNIFAVNFEAENGKWRSGTYIYNGCPTSIKEYVGLVLKNGRGDVETYNNVQQPAYINMNCYLDGVKMFENEKEYYRTDKNPGAKIYNENGHTYLEIELPDECFDLPTSIIATDEFEMPRISDSAFESPNGEAIRFNTDVFGSERSAHPTPGPIEDLKPGYNKILLY